MCIIVFQLLLLEYVDLHFVQYQNSPVFFFTIFIPNIKQMIGVVTGIMVLALAATGTTWKTGRGTVYMLRVTQDVSLERATRNYNWLPYLMVSKLTDFPNKRSLVQFENVPNPVLRQRSYLPRCIFIMYMLTRQAGIPSKKPRSSPAICRCGI